MKPALLAALVLAPLLAAPAAAQGTDRCRALLQSLPLRPQEPPAGVEAEGPDACRYGPMRLDLGGAVGYEVGRTLIRGAPPVAGGPAAALRVEARGIVLSVRTGNPAQDWMLRQQAVPFDIVLDLTHDPVTRRTELRELSMEGEALGRVSVEAAAEGGAVPRNLLHLWAEADRSGLLLLRLRLDSRRYVATFLLPAMVPLLPPDDPGGAVERMKVEVARRLRDLLSGPAGEAAARFAADFPHPRHPFVLTLRPAAAPVRPGDLPGGGPWEAMLEAVARLFRVEATYEGAFR